MCEMMNFGMSAFGGIGFLLGFLISGLLITVLVLLAVYLYKKIDFKAKKELKHKVKIRR